MHQVKQYAECIELPRATETISIKLCAKQYIAKGNPVLNRIQIHYLGKIIKSYWNIFINTLSHFDLKVKCCAEACSGGKGSGLF